MAHPPASKAQEIRMGNYYLSWSGLTNSIKNNSEWYLISIDAINDEQKLAGS